MIVLIVLLMGAVLPVSAQYTGPAILTRGEIPRTMQPAQIDFRPYLRIQGIYDSDMAGVTASREGDRDAYGVEASFGVYGLHRWKRTSVGLDYRGAFRHYSTKSYFDGTDHTVSLGFTRQLSRRAALALRESAGTYTRSFGMFSFGGQGTFDPTLGYLPANDYFDNRTDFVSSQADLTLQKTARLSFNLGGDAFLVRYRSRALYGVTGGAARGDVAYRTGRHTTIGATYSFAHFRFSRHIGGTDLHSVLGTFARRLSAHLEMAVYGGVLRAESRFIRAVALDPAIAALLGVSTQLALTHRLDTAPQAGARLIRQFRNASFAGNFSYGITPGNGVFLTSTTGTVSTNYTYTGLRRWNFGWTGSYTWAEAHSDLTGNYKTGSAGLGATRQISRATHITLRADLRRFLSDTYRNYDRTIYRATLGLAFTPKDVPLRLW